MKEPFKSLEKILVATLYVDHDMGTSVMARSLKWAPEAKIKQLKSSSTKKLKVSVQWFLNKTNRLVTIGIFFVLT